MGRVLACGLTLMTLAAAVAADEEIPAPFARFEPMVGAWKGQAVPAVNRLKGWPEKHAWAWKFVKGTPVGMTLAVEGGKVFTKGELTFDPKTSRYTLAASDPAGKPVSFSGAPSADNKALVLERTTPDGKERLSIQSAGGGIRYVMKLDRQDVGAPQFKNAIEVGLTKEGESFAAGGEAANLPKCILTGGAATLSVTFNGKSYPVCCTGCRDEFNENPEKYVARAEAKAAAGGSEKTAAKPSAPARGASEFEGLVDEPKAMPKASAKKADTPAVNETKPAAKSTPKAGTAEAKAASDLRLGQAFERAGKPDRALDTYKALVKKYSDTDAAKTAADRIKALEK
ncbi:MAG TPA: hypothetical protein VGH33_09215 [Isosphaeraceae bacterium]